MANFAKVAASGGFAISETGGKAVIDAMTSFQEWVTSQSDKLDIISQKPMLGGSTGAQVMAPYTQQVAIDGQGFATQLRALQESLDQAKEGIRKAMEAYRDADATGSSGMNQAGGTLSA